MKALVLIFCAALSACTTIESKYHKGDVVISQHFTNFPQYNNQFVLVVEELKWRWIKDGSALIVYEVETVDGSRIAAQEFQLKSVDQIIR